MAGLIIFLCISAFSSLHYVSSSSVLCSLDSNSFLFGLQYQCPLSISPNLPLQDCDFSGAKLTAFRSSCKWDVWGAIYICSEWQYINFYDFMLPGSIEVTGSFIQDTLTFRQKIGYTSVLFYASWCPFSLNMYPKFEALSSMFPQIDHFSVEQSSAMPSVFSRYGIHSLPSILMVNQTSRIRYHGPKDLHSLVQFYEKTTGLKPVQYLDEDQQIGLESGKKFTSQSISGSALREISKKEPYLVASTLFLFLRILVSLFPRVLCRLKAFWVSYVPHLNLGILGETSQIIGRVTHMIDVSGFWTKLRLCKTRNLREGARNARVWASSLASVSLGESSSTRSSH